MAATVMGTLNAYLLLAGPPTGGQLGHFALGPILLGGPLCWRPYTINDKLLTF